MAVELNSLLVRTPGVNGGKLCLEGTGFSMFRAASLFQQGYTAEEIGYEYPHLKLSHLYAALAYYLVNRDEVDREMGELQAEGERLMKEHLAAKAQLRECDTALPR